MGLRWYDVYNKKPPYEITTSILDKIAEIAELYRQMNGMSLRDMDKVVYPVCKLCRDHEKAGFIEGIKVGIRLQAELIE